MAILGLGLAPIIGLALLHHAVAAPVLVYNPSGSEPRGFYRLTSQSPALGRLIVFRVPASGRDYAGQNLGHLVRGGILKEIAAGPGSTVCERSGKVFIDRRLRARVSEHDSNGRPLPHWSGCQTLTEGEFFAFSDRIPNSFDSRYYGPVQQSEVVGVYAPIWTE